MAKTLVMVSAALCLSTGLFACEGSEAGLEDGGQSSIDSGERQQGSRDAGSVDGSLVGDSGSDASTILDAGPPMEPGDPGSADVRFDVDTGADVHPISPYIYGHNQSERLPEATLLRAGGNRWTAYNWENNASNAGSDWCHQNDGRLRQDDMPGLAAGQRTADAHGRGAAIMVTVPILGYVAADKAGGSGPPACGGDVANSGTDYLDTRFVRSVASKGSAFTYPPDSADGVVYQDEFVSWLNANYTEGEIFYSLDNEPDLWSDTHARIHPEALRYDALLAAGIEYAQAIKAVVPGGRVFGPANFGWSGMVRLQNAPDAAGRDFLAFYLAGMATAEESGGQRLLDVLDFHWYPEARGDGVRVGSDAATAGLVEARMQAPRSLWDETYVEQSWITRSSTDGPVRLLPRMRELVEANYPGTELSISEYYYGGGEHISGAIAQADVLGIYAREDLFAAALWHTGATDDRYINGAFAAYRDYDGAGGLFGDVSVRATTDDISGTSVHASMSTETPGRVVLVAINKTGAAVDVALRIRHPQALSTLQSYVISEGSPRPIVGVASDASATNAFLYTMPALSVSTLVLD